MHDERNASPARSYGFESANIDIGIRKELSPRRQYMQKVGIEGKSVMRVACDYGDSSAFPVVGVTIVVIVADHVCDADVEQSTREVALARVVTLPCHHDDFPTCAQEWKVLGPDRAGVELTNGRFPRLAESFCDAGACIGHKQALSEIKMHDVGPS